MTEYGIFNPEGCVERGYYSAADAEAALAQDCYEEDDELYVSALCDEHEEQPRDSCEECYAEECYAEESDEEDEDEDED